jgi:hypothetical protein
VTLHWHPYRWLIALRIVVAAAGIAIVLATDAPPVVAVAPVVTGELIGRYLFYVTVVPLNIPGSFTSRKRHPR